MELNLVSNTDWRNAVTRTNQFQLHFEPPMASFQAKVANSDFPLNDVRLVT